MPTLTYPGVYIEEFTPGAPIEGVGTSTAVFIGPAMTGDLDEPTKITSFDQFRTTFGEEPVPGFYLWYAVRGFFENGGQVCYVVRASNGDYAEAELNNADGSVPLIRVRARQPGNPAAAIHFEITEAHLVPDTTTLFQPTATLVPPVVGRVLTLQAGEGANFRPGDWISVGNPGERVQILRVSGDDLRLASEPAVNPPTTNDVRLADETAARIVRIRPVATLAQGALVPGTMLTITQGGTPVSQTVDSVQVEPPIGGIPTYRVRFTGPLTMPLSLDPANSATVRSEEFNIEVSQGAPATLYDNLAIDPAHPRYFAQIINANSRLVRVELIDPPPPLVPPNNLPELTGTDLAGGANEDLSALGDADYLEALETLEEIDDVNLVAIPERVSLAVQQEVIAHCELKADRFAVLDAIEPVPDQELFGPDAESIETQRAGLESARGYAAFYYPWLRVPPLRAGRPILVPPSGHMCGVMARSDNERGVHKAPANEIIRGAVGVERILSDLDHGQLNIGGTNIIRVFRSGGRPYIFGARTTSPDTSWRYVNIRRLFLFIEESIQEGIRWAIFEPNNLQLWQKLRRTIGEFLTRVWRDGALFGATPEEAFYVRIDEVLNPFSEQQLGRLYIEIGVRPSYPAEFIIVRIGIWPGGSEITET